MTELFFGLCETEGLVNFVPFAFMADERSDLALVPENTGYHGCVP